MSLLKFRKSILYIINLIIPGSPMSRFRIYKINRYMRKHKCKFGYGDIVTVTSPNCIGKDLLVLAYDHTVKEYYCEKLTLRTRNYNGEFGIGHRTWYKADQLITGPLFIINNQEKLDHYMKLHFRKSGVLQ